MSNTQLSLEDINIRTDIRPGDLNHVARRHGIIYGDELNFATSFEDYVREGLDEFYQNYDPQKDRAWICEHQNTIVGFLVLMHRPDNTAQLRYFYLEKAYRGIGLGSKLMKLFMEFFKNRGYQAAYLLTVDELLAAASLYKKHGFKLTESKASIFFGKQLHEQRYDLDLT